MDDQPDPPLGRVILTYARSYQALAAVRSLGRRGIEVVAGDEYALTPGALSRYTIGRFTYPSPAADPDGFLDAIDRAIDEHAPGDDRPYVLMPVHQETSLVARARARFEDRVAIPIAPYDSIRIAEHKSKLARYAMELDVPTPRTVFPRSAGEVRALVAEMQLPVFVKVPIAASGVGVVKVESPDEAARTFDELVERYGLEPADYPLVQEAAPGDDICVTTLFDRGELCAQMTYRNVLTWPRGHGAGVIRETVDAPLAERLAERIGRTLVWHGIAQLDFRWTGRDGDPPRLLEINPRFFGGMFQAVAAGVDYPWLLYRVACGLPVTQPDLDPNARTEAPVLGLLATLREIAADESAMESLESAWNAARHEMGDGHGWRAVRTIVKGLRPMLEVEQRIARAKQLLEENEHNVSVLFDQDDDPLPALGLMYPLSVFLRHGKVSHELMSSVESASPDE